MCSIRGKSGKVQNMDPWSMDRVQQNMDRVHGPSFMDGSMDPTFHYNNNVKHKIKYAK